MAIRFYNDKDRIAFLENYRNDEAGWYLWHDMADTVGLRWWRHDDVSDDFALVVVEELFSGTTPDIWPETTPRWRAKHYYMVRDWGQPFADAVTNRTQVLKEMKKKTPVKEEQK